MVLLHSLQLRDFLSHEATDITFKEDTNLLLDGPSGHGKSSVIDAIVWALYGIGRSDNRSLVRKGTKRGLVRLELYDETKTYVITRSITAGGKHALDITERSGEGPEIALSGTEGLRGYQAWIEKDLLGASYLLFTNSVAYLQDRGDNFVQQTASKRKDMLLELVKAEDFDTYYENARTELSKVENDIKIIDIEMDRIGKFVASTEERLTTRYLLEARLDGLRALIKSMEDTLKSRQASLDAMKDYVEKVSFLKGMLMSATEQSESFKKEISVIEALGKEVGDITQEKLNKIVADQEARGALYLARPTTNYKSLLENAQARLNAFNEKLSDAPECPSGDLCPHQHDAASNLQTIEDEVSFFEGKYKEEQEALKENTRLSDALVPYPGHSVVTKMGKYLEEVKKLPELARRLAVAEEGRSALEKQMVQASTLFDPEKEKELKREIFDLTSKISGSRQQESHTVGELAVLDNLQKQTLDELDKLKVCFDKRGEALKVASKLSLVKEAFGSKGVKTIVVDYILPRLEDSVNDILSKLSDFRIRFDTQRLSSDGESQVEGLFITILNDIGEEMAFENYSGGEKLKITVAISEALAGLQKVGFRIFDEVFQGLDETSTESFASVLRRLQAKYGQVICISHLPTIKDMFEEVLTVRKEGGVSYLSTV